MVVAKVPPIRDRIPSLERSPRRFGAILPIPPMIIATEPKLANPQRAYVVIMKLRSLNGFELSITIASFE